jgi:TolA-binding protein
VPAGPTPAELAGAALEKARATLAEKRDEEAVTELRALISQYPTTSAALEADLLIAQVYERQNRLGEVLAVYREARQRHPADERIGDVMLREARVTMRTRAPDRNQQARRLLAESAERFPAAPSAAPALALRAQIEERERIREPDAVLGITVPAALVTWRLVAERYPSASATALSKLSEYYKDLRRYDLAAQALVDLATRFPASHTGALFEAGDLYEKRVKDRAKAMEIYALIPPSSDRYRRAQDRIRDLARQN